MKMSELANAIVLQVGWIQYHRMNLMRIGLPITVDDEMARAMFLDDLEERTGVPVVDFLIDRLHDSDPHHYRLSLPDGHVLCGSRMLARPGVCAFCDERRAWHERSFPPHFPSRMCESGRRPHCTCDYCF